MTKEQEPCPEHPDAGRYSNGACKRHAIERQQARYRANREEALAYAKEYAKTYTPPPRAKRHRPYDPEAYKRAKAAKAAREAQK